ncbi:hypothetical protein BD408DRAFT_412202 [Parasitella parasitica]|nr:hypothetical protein BD408DRAFT_412202 [Parasitella parasitica]
MCAPLSTCRLSFINKMKGSNATDNFLICILMILMSILFVLTADALSAGQVETES